MDPLEKYRHLQEPEITIPAVPQGKCATCGADVAWIVDRSSGYTAVCAPDPVVAYTSQGRKLEAYVLHEC